MIWDQAKFSELLALHSQMEAMLKELRDLGIWDEELERIENLLRSIPSPMEPHGIELNAPPRPISSGW